MLSHDLKNKNVVEFNQNIINENNKTTLRDKEFIKTITLLTLTINIIT